MITMVIDMNIGRGLMINLVHTAISGCPAILLLLWLVLRFHLVKNEHKVLGRSGDHTRTKHSLDVAVGVATASGHVTTHFRVRKRTTLEKSHVHHETARLHGLWEPVGGFVGDG
jgi:hypothetical protein